MEDDAIISKFIPVDMSKPFDDISAACIAALGQVKEELGAIDGVTTFSEMAMPLATALAHTLQLPGR